MATGKKKIKYGTRKKKMKKIYETVLSLKTKYNLGQKTKYIKYLIRTLISFLKFLNLFKLELKGKCKHSF